MVNFFKHYLFLYPKLKHRRYLYFNPLRFNRLRLKLILLLCLSSCTSAHAQAVQVQAPPNQNMSLSEFEQFLKSNGYAQNAPQAPTTQTSTTTTTIQTPPPNLILPSPQPTTTTTTTVQKTAKRSEISGPTTLQTPAPAPAPTTGMTTETTTATNLPLFPAFNANMLPINPVQDIPLENKPQTRPSKARARPLTYEENLQIMLRSAPPSLVPQTEDSAIAFSQLLQQNIPLSPQQVVQLRQQIDVAQRAAAITPVIPPKPVSSTLMINLAPGTTPPAVRLAQGYVSSLLFVDSTGSPWPIAAFDVGNPKALNIQWDGKSNILLLQATNPYSDGDIVIRLVGLATPITLELVSGQRVVDYRVDIHVSGIGPNTKELPIGTSLPNGANQLLLGVLDGVAPAGSKLLSVRGADAQAWLLGERMYLRTRFTVLSPGWIGTMVSSDGMHAYEMPRTSSVLISRYGEPADIKIEGF